MIMIGDSENRYSIIENKSSIDDLYIMIDSIYNNPDPKFAIIKREDKSLDIIDVSEELIPHDPTILELKYYKSPAFIIIFDRDKLKDISCKSVVEVSIKTEHYLKFRLPETDEAMYSILDFISISENNTDVIENSLYNVGWVLNPYLFIAYKKSENIHFRYRRWKK